mmetsp:Transcript_7576/g.13722  ORF Transcript_7576/g.13722 Transcript_7576/m.13722 type:complete len:88 (-) Transcript_7576:504-767(-)
MDEQGFVFAFQAGSHVLNLKSLQKHTLLESSPVLCFRVIPCAKSLRVQLFSMSNNSETVTPSNQRLVVCRVCKQQYDPSQNTSNSCR